MKKQMWIAMALSAAVFGSTVGCSGLGTKEAENNQKVQSSFETEDMKLDTPVMAVGEEEVTLNEMLFYVYQLKSGYDSALSSAVWGYSYEEGKTIESNTKEELVKEIAQIKIICQEAEKQGNSLTEEEANQAKVAAEQYVDALPKSAKAYCLSEKLVEKIYKEHALAKKMYDVVGGTIDTEVSDAEVGEGEDATKEKEKILAEREKTAFTEAYQKWKENYKIVVSRPLLDSISFQKE